MREKESLEEGKHGETKQRFLENHASVHVSTVVSR